LMTDDDSVPVPTLEEYMGLRGQIVVQEAPRPRRNNN